MNCDELVERVTDYHEGALSQTDRARWDEHVGVCVGCVAHLGAYDVTVRLVSSVDPEPLPDPLAATLMAIHRQWVASVGT
jgi:anti-sigma factor RsiW